jgi:hypothetical protein
MIALQPFDNDAFPESVTAFEDVGRITIKTGADGVAREMLEIPGGSRGQDGAFHFIKNADGTINHRLFVAQ